MYAVIDIETGGFSKTKNGLCEIAIIILNQEKKRVLTYETLIRPYKRRDEDKLVSYKEDAMEVNGIKVEELEKAPDADYVAQLIEGLFTWFKIKTIVAHNVKFDKPWIEEFLDRFGDKFKFQDSICTLEMSKEWTGRKSGNDLTSMCEEFNIENSESHRAMGDAKATLELWEKLRLEDL